MKALMDSEIVKVAIYLVLLVVILGGGVGFAYLLHHWLFGRV
jgi:hypothetical protein